MRTTSAIQFYVRTSKASKDGYSPLECSVSICGQRKFVNLPMKFRAEEFNKKRPSKEILQALDLWRNRINGYMVQMLREGMVITAQTLREVIQQGGVNTYTVGRLFDDYLILLSKRVGIDLTAATYRKYQIVADKALKYIHRDADISSITPALIQTIAADFRALYDPSTTVGYLTKLKTFMKYGMDNGKIRVNPFQGVKIQRPLKPIKALTETELNGLLNKCCDSVRLQKVLDLFLIQCGTGMAYSDLMDFSPEDMKQEGDYYYICKQRNKTGKTFTALVMPFAVPIIQHYKTLPKISNQKLNKNLKLIDKRLTSHMGRRTYATLLVNNGVDMHIVAAALGDHPAMAAKYYAKVFDSTIIQQQIDSIKKGEH